MEVRLCSALNQEGLAELVEAISTLHREMADEGIIEQRRTDQRIASYWAT
ncbi:MAG: hypothetical protein R2706_19890 [Acidimicrobiales bacterium]